MVEDKEERERELIFPEKKKKGKRRRRKRRRKATPSFVYTHACMHTCMHTKKAQDVFYGDFLRLLASSGVKRVPPGSEQAVCSALSERLWKLSAH